MAKVAAVSGCSGPRTFSLILRARWYRGGLVVGAHSPVLQGQIVEADGGRGVPVPGLLPDLQGPIVQGLGLGIPA